MYRQDLDIIKGLSIIAVVLYHMGFINSGYLGVDAFFVVNGFLIIPSVFKHIENGDFSIWAFLQKRIIRLLPLIILASIICLVVGYFVMMPDHYENTAQSVIASLFFSNNVLSAITTKNYWDVGNDFKPLMHLWYVGILFEFYVLLPLILITSKHIAVLLKKNIGKCMKGSLLIFTLVSFIMFILPSTCYNGIMNNGEVESFKFYFIFTRFYELALGGIIALYALNLTKHNGHLFNNFYFLIILCVIFACSLYTQLTEPSNTTRLVVGAGSGFSSTGLPLPKPLLLICTVLTTCILLLCDNRENNNHVSKILAWIGRMSYSIFIWHQVLLAYYRYAIGDSTGFKFSLFFLLIVLICSILSYYFVEQQILNCRKTFALCIISGFIVIIPSIFIYNNAGVTKDIPELECTLSDAHRGMWGEYCDRVYAYDKDFPEHNGKINVLVEGVSFGRDFCNVLLESIMADYINLSYVFTWNSNDYSERVAQADYIFTLGAKDKVPDYVWENLKSNTKVYGIGTKSFGKSNGRIFIHRNERDYFTLTAQPDDGYWDANKMLRKSWGDHYIDFMEPVRKGDGVQVFTPDHKYISQDCSHLTKAGASMYSQMFDWKRIFN